MKPEDLFLAIGEVESSRLARSELTMECPSARETEEPDMKKKRVNPRRIIRNLLIAAVIVSMLAVTAYAAVGYLIFDNPEEMISAIFGDETGYDHSEGSITPFEDGINVIIEPTFDRVPVDEEVAAEEAAPLVEAVGQSISWEGYTLTVDANLYDAVTGCGFLTYTLENPEGLDYSLQSTGEVWFPSGEPVDFSQYGYSYIIQDQSTDTRLTATYYYQIRDTEDTDLEISFSWWSDMSRQDYIQWFVETKQQLKQEVSEEEAYEYVKQLTGEDFALVEAETSRESIIEQGYDAMAYERMGVLDDQEEQSGAMDKIIIPAASSGEMSSITLGNGAITMSPVAMCIDMAKIENYPRSFVDVAKIQFADGTEYVVKDGYTLNYVFNVGSSGGTDSTFMFNRIIDVKEVTAIIMDGDIELTVD